MKLPGKIAIITGGGSGIGAATAQLFAVEGAKVVVADVSQEGAEAVAEEVRRKGGEALACRWTSPAGRRWRGWWPRPWTASAGWTS